MNKMKKTLFKNEKGLTLVEVLASIVILSIIFISILMILLQTMKTNKVSEEIIDATYLAQTEMENIYEASKKSERITWFTGNGYQQESSVDNWEVFSKSVEETDYIIKVSWKDTEDQMTRIIVKVYDKTDSSEPKVQMENLLKWRANDEATP